MSSSFGLMVEIVRHEGVSAVHVYAKDPATRDLLGRFEKAGQAHGVPYVGYSLPDDIDSPASGYGTAQKAMVKTIAPLSMAMVEAAALVLSEVGV